MLSELHYNKHYNKIRELKHRENKIKKKRFMKINKKTRLCLYLFLFNKLKKRLRFPSK